jgi:hypothetical protein
MSFKKLAGESIVEAWERYHLFMAYLPVDRMEDWDFTQGFYYGLSQDPLVPTSQRLQLADCTMVQPYEIAENVLIEFQDSSTLVDFMVEDMDPHQ